MQTPTSIRLFKVHRNGGHFVCQVRVGVRIRVRVRVRSRVTVRVRVTVWVKVWILGSDFGVGIWGRA